MVLDLLSDMLTRINNGYKVKLPHTYVLRSKQNLIVLGLLMRLGYISSYVLVSMKHIRVDLVYYRNQPAIRKLTRVSKAKNRIYLKVKELHNRSGLAFSQNGFLILSTTAGIVTDVEALSLGLGGEVLFQVI